MIKMQSEQARVNKRRRAHKAVLELLRGYSYTGISRRGRRSTKQSELTKRLKTRHKSKLAFFAAIMGVDDENYRAGR